MSVPPDQQLIVAQLPKALGRLLAQHDAQTAVRADITTKADAVLKMHEQTFVVAVTAVGSAGPVTTHARRAQAAAQQLSSEAIPVVATSFMGRSGKEACGNLGVSWFDLSGNAHIITPSMRVIVDGRQNRFRRRGRPASAFAPKSARVARWLLTHLNESFTQRKIAQATNISEGLVSRVVSRLVSDGYVTRNDEGQVCVSAPGLLFDAWGDEYRIDRHTIVHGHLAARSGDSLTRQVSDILTGSNIDHAATGLAAAWQMTQFAPFRIASFYTNLEAVDLLTTHGLREDPRGANLWLLLPNDSGVYESVAEFDDVPCVHPVQATLDLLHHPERAVEAADHIRATLLGW